MGLDAVFGLVVAMAITYGWQPTVDNDPGFSPQPSRVAQDGTVIPAADLDYIVQISPDCVDAVRRSGHVSSTIDPQVRGRVARVIVRFGNDPLPRIAPTPSGTPANLTSSTPTSGKTDNLATALASSDTTPIPIPELNDDDWTGQPAEPIAGVDGESAVLKPDAGLLQIPTLGGGDPSSRTQTNFNQAGRDLANGARSYADEELRRNGRRLAELGSRMAGDANQPATTGGVRTGGFALPSTTASQQLGPPTANRGAAALGLPSTSADPNRTNPATAPYGTNAVRGPSSPYPNDTQFVGPPAPNIDPRTMAASNVRRDTRGYAGSNLSSATLPLRQTTSGENMADTNNPADLDEDEIAAGAIGRSGGRLYDRNRQWVTPAMVESVARQRRQQNPLPDMYVASQDPQSASDLRNGALSRAGNQMDWPRGNTMQNDRGNRGQYADAGPADQRYRFDDVTDRTPDLRYGVNGSNDRSIPNLYADRGSRLGRGALRSDDRDPGFDDDRSISLREKDLIYERDRERKERERTEDQLAEMRRQLDEQKRDNDRRKYEFERMQAIAVAGGNSSNPTGAAVVPGVGGNLNPSQIVPRNPQTRGGFNGGPPNPRTAAATGSDVGEVLSASDRRNDQPTVDSEITHSTTPFFNGLLLVSGIVNCYLCVWLRGMRTRYRDLVSSSRLVETA